ncbi:hypothetical protein C8R45DRAFT_973264 [Mycena sanguinolenta]|nr:hypothetical protein C8R45DRAFT_973264 [Mycena sanguinolenta]
MKGALSFVALLSLEVFAVSSTLPSGGVVSSSCAAGARVLVETRNVTVNGHEIQVSTKACSGNSIASRTFEQRQTTVALACERRSTTLECAVGPPTAPVPGDCATLQADIPTFIAEQPCNFFLVPPQFVQTLSFGTCLYGWINDNAVGGVTLEGCWTDVETFGEILTVGCIEAGQIAGIAFPTTAVANEAWVFEVVHS